MTIRAVDKLQHPKSGDPRLHEELGWYATDNDTVLGVVIRDRVDDNFSWLMLTCNEQGPGYTAIDLGASLPTQRGGNTGLAHRDGATRLTKGRNLSFGYSRAIHSREFVGQVAVALQERCERGVGVFPLRLCERGRRGMPLESCCTADIWFSVQVFRSVFHPGKKERIMQQRSDDLGRPPVQEPPPEHPIPQPAEPDDDDEDDDSDDEEDDARMRAEGVDVSSHRAPRFRLRIALLGSGPNPNSPGVEVRRRSRSATPALGARI